jgi:ABC-type uncharacterized transport system ATPase subunit
MLRFSGKTSVFSLRNGIYQNLNFLLSETKTKTQHFIQSVGFLPEEYERTLIFALKKRENTTFLMHCWVLRGMGYSKEWLTEQELKKLLELPEDQ